MHRPVWRATLVAFATLLTTSLLADSPLKPNSVKYKDSGITAAKGRAGSAAIEARALLNQDGSADVEVTTGSFDSTATAPGTIVRVQLALPSGPVRNFNDLDAGGTFTANLRGLRRGEIAGVQANVRDIDARTGVVSVDAKAGYRPDLTVTGITPDSATLGASTNVRATIRELNGDYGARANCLLYVNGVEADRAEGIWVDAAGAVQCAFVTTFASAGTANVEVAVEQVNPGDWNVDNNRASHTITVSEPAQTFAGFTASVTEEEFSTYDYRKDGDFYEVTRETSGIEQSINFRGTFRTTLTHENLSMRVVTESDGQLIADNTQVEPWSTIDLPWMRCSLSFGNPEVFACTDLDGGSSEIEYHFAAADATYRSRGWYTRAHPWAPEVPRYEWNDTTVTDTILARFGSSVNMKVTVEDGGTTHEAAPFIASLSTRTRRMDRPYACYYDDYIQATTCSESRSVRTTRRGSAF